MYAKTVNCIYETYTKWALGYINPPQKHHFPLLLAIIPTLKSSNCSPPF